MSLFVRSLDRVWTFVAFDAWPMRRIRDWQQRTGHGRDASLLDVAIWLSFSTAAVALVVAAAA